MIWYCVICDFAYNEDDGLPVQGIPPGTQFEDIPDTWHCPECSIEKSFFKLLD